MRRTRRPTPTSACTRCSGRGRCVWALTRGGESGAFPGGAVSSVSAIGRSLFTSYAFAFEVTSVLILVAMVGAVILARRDPVDRGGRSAAPGDR